MPRNQTTTAPSAAVEDIREEAAKDLTPARKALQEALEAKQRAIVLAEKAEKVFAAANSALQQALGEASKYKELDAQDLTARLDALKGDPDAKKRQETIREARRARIVANEEVTSANLTLQAAQRELQESQENIVRAGKVCASHATGVLSEITTAVIAMWDHANREREVLRVILDSLVMVKLRLETLSPQKRADLFQQATSPSGLPFGNTLDWENLQQKADEALKRSFAQKDPGPGTARARAYWASIANEVLSDPAAELDRFPIPSAAEFFG